MSRVVVKKNSRLRFNDASLAYPFPLDLADIHRQTLLTLLVFSIYGRPILSAAIDSQPPRHVLELGCGSGLWSMQCHRYLKAQHGGHRASFVGMDIMPLAEGVHLCERDMTWNFMQHDIRSVPWPFPSASFDLVMSKDISLGLTGMQYAIYMEEMLRVLKPGGILEIWDFDSTFRMMKRHAPKPSQNSSALTELGVYSLDAEANTPMSPPINRFLIDYNSWVTKALEKRGLAPTPCAMIGPYLAQEAETIKIEVQRRVAIPLGEIRWEGVETLSPEHAGLRRAALETVMSTIQSYEHILADVTGKNQDEWDLWFEKAAEDLVLSDGAQGGVCLEIGAWSARKKDV